MRIERSVALVTGGGRGLGRAIATRLADQGATLAVLDRDREALGTLPSDWGAWAVDVTRPEQVGQVMAEVVARFGRIDVLVNNAGVIFSEPFVNLANPLGVMHDYERFRSCITANLDSVFIVTAAAVEQMVRHRTRGVIVNVSSISARGNPGQTAYSAAKAGVEAMTVTWARELGRWGIRCNAVAPGFIDTESTRSAVDESVLRHVTANTPLRRLGSPEEVAQAVVSLVDNDFITGVVLDVNGGLPL